MSFITPGFLQRANIAATFGDPTGATGRKGELKVDPTTGDLYRNTDGGTTWALFFSAGPGVTNYVVVNYISDGSASPDVAIGASMPGSYAVVHEDDTIAAFVGLQIPVANHTATTFRVLFDVAPTVGDKFTFVVFAN